MTTDTTDQDPLTFDSARRVMLSLHQAEDGEHGTVAVPGYVVDRALGSGSSGTTYVARKVGSEALVAVKVLRLPSGGSGLGSRVWRELDTLMHLRVSRCPRLLDFGTTDTAGYVVTEFIDGTPLSEWKPTDEDADGLASRVRLVRDLALAVQSLHERGLIHRDIKPSNVIITEHEEPFVIDFGLARWSDQGADPSFTLEGSPLGTPAFMSPEQARGDQQAISTRSDVYSLGATGYWLICGAPPHKLESVAVHEAIRRVAQAPCRAPSQIWPETPPPLAAVLQKACAQVPSDRYASASALAEDLTRFLNGEPVSASSPTLSQRLGDWVSRHPKTVVVLLAGSLLPLGVAALAAGAYVTNLRPHHIEIGPNRDFMEIRALNDRVLFRRDSEGRVLLAEWATPEGDRSARGAFLVVTNEFSRSAGLPSLLIARTSRPTEPLVEFQPPVRTPDALRYALGSEVTSERFAPSSARLADIFPGPAGDGVDELVVSFHHGEYSPASVRVYSLAGELLFDAWHDGHLADVEWLPAIRELVIAGCNSDGKWEERGESPRLSAYPPVVFAIRPEQGLHEAVISWPGHEGTIDPLWYYAVMPPELSDFVIPTRSLRLRPAIDPEGRSVGVLLEASDCVTPGWERLMAALRWEIGPGGEVLNKRATSTWSTERGFPDPDRVTLGELPLRAAARASE